MDSLPILAGNYDYRLVAISVFISILAAYAALDLAERVTTARGRSRLVWLYCGAAAMGIGIWAMHYVGMVAFHLPIPVLYDWPTVLLSLFTAVVGSGVALYIVSQPSMGLARTVGGSLIMGSGIAAMHYIGMGAMRLNASCVYQVDLVLLSVILAVIISCLALQLAFAGRHNHSNWGPRKLWSGLIMGLAIPTMHYAGMAAVHFVPEPQLNGSLTHAVAITPLVVAVIVAATVVILGNVFVVSIVSRGFSLQAEQLTQNALQLRTIFDNLMEGIIVLDSGDGLIQMNPAVSRILGLPDEAGSREYVVETLTALTLDGAVLAPEEWPSARALRGDFVKNVELEFRSSYTGKSTIVEVSTAPIVNATGDLVQAIITYREVSERKRTEEARARLAAIVESSRDAIVGKDLHGIVTSWNKGAENIFGYRAEEIIGQSITLLLLPPGQEAEEDGILERIGRGETIEMPDTTRQRKDGKLINVSLMICPVRQIDGKIVGVSKIARDITERKLLERQWRQSQKMEAIGQLTGGIAHDFNNLLAIVIGNLGLMERLIAGNEEATKRLKPAQKAASRGADLTRRLLALASKEDLNPANTLIEDAIRETVELAGRALGPEILIVTNSDPSVPAVFVDGAGLESALLNLAVNARDAMPKGGTLTFSTELIDLDDSFPSVRTMELQPGPYARISVSDTGHGMSKETLERAFEPFFTTKGREKGTGLGLAMVYGFARQSGGTVRLYSELGYGTTVTLYLPLAGESAPAAREIPPSYVFVHAGGTVLVVDDEPDLLEIAHTYLTEMGYSALRADNAASALNTLAIYKEIDLMITDIIMPGGMNGAELAREARELNPKLKVIYSSGYPSDALVERSGTKVDGPLLRKPYQRAEFAAIIQRALHGAAQ
jgi:PAS domain S-box-containing protein